MSYYRLQQQREVLGEIEGETLCDIAERIIDLREKLEAAEERIVELEAELVEATND